MQRAILFPGYAVIMVACVLLAFFVFAQPAPGPTSDRSNNFLAGVGVGFAGCVFFKDALGLIRDRRERGKATARSAGR
jgi:hypothetical protein